MKTFKTRNGKTLYKMDTEMWTSTDRTVLLLNDGETLVDMPVAPWGDLEAMKWEVDALGRLHGWL